MNGRTFTMLKFRSMVVDADRQARRAPRGQHLRRPAVQDARRPAGHPGRPLAAPALARRAAAAAQRARRLHVAGRPAAAAAGRGRPLRHPVSRRLLVKPGPHRPVADLRPQRPAVGGGRAPRPAVRRELVAGDGPADPRGRPPAPCSAAPAPTEPAPPPGGHPGGGTASPRGGPEPPRRRLQDRRRLPTAACGPASPPTNGLGRTAMSIAMVGTRGVPARYGGFETAVEEVGRRLADRGSPGRRLLPHRPRRDDRAARRAPRHGAGAPARRAQALAGDAQPHRRCRSRHLRRPPHRRRLRLQRRERAAAARCCAPPASRSPRTSTGWSGSAPSGAAPAGGTTASPRAWPCAGPTPSSPTPQGIADYYRDEFGAPTTLLTYGAPAHRARVATGWPSSAWSRGGYHLVVARFEPENHVDLIVEGYAPQRGDQAAGRRRLGALLRRVHRAGCTPLADDRVRFLGGVWDQELLDQLYANCAHLPARPLGRRHQPVAAARHRRRRGRARLRRRLQPRGPRRRRAVLRQRRRTSPRWSTRAEADPAGVRPADGARRASWPRRYDWDDVAAGYEELAAPLAAPRLPEPAPDRPPDAAVRRAATRRHPGARAPRPRRRSSGHRRSSTSPGRQQ